MERQLLAHCAREEVSLAALTNGLRWLLFLWSPGGGRMERRFCEIDLRGDPEAAAADVNRYLSRDRVSNGQAARSAERALRDSNREEVERRAIIQGWRQVVGGLDEGLIELVATAAEQRAGHRLVRRVLAENRAALLAPGAGRRAPKTPQRPARAAASAIGGIKVDRAGGRLQTVMMCLCHPGSAITLWMAAGGAIYNRRMSAITRPRGTL